MGKMVKVIAIVDEEQKRLLYHILLDEKKSFAEWLREQMDAYLKKKEPKGKPRRK